MLRGLLLGVAVLAVAGCGGAESAPDEQRQTDEQPMGMAGAAGSSTDEPPAPAEPICDAGRQVECPCPNGGKGAQACADDGSKWGACQCEEAKPPKPEESPTEACGPPENHMLQPEEACPPNKPSNYLDISAAHKCLAPFLDAGVCVLSPGAGVFVCCPL